jgi:hypothetical protein
VVAFGSTGGKLSTTVESDGTGETISGSVLSVVSEAVSPQPTSKKDANSKVPKLFNKVDFLRTCFIFI